MPRHRFRSQPELQRTGGWTPTAVAGLWLLAGVGVIAGALITTLSRDPGFNERQAVAPPRGDFLRFGHAPELPTAENPVEQAAPAAEPAPAPRAARPPLARPLARTAPHAKPTTPVEKPPNPQQTWESRRLDYERARATYDSNERTEGYQWARQNRVRLARYCQVAAQRTAAFVEGCMSYVGR